MKAMLTAFAACILIAVVADIGLDRIGFTSEERQSADSVRLD
ncbi:hypothetical protein [Jannaschia marina]|nr:hypothetical protein [Jannaschia marina]